VGDAREKLRQILLFHVQMAGPAAPGFFPHEASEATWPLPVVFALNTSLKKGSWRSNLKREELLTI